MGAGSHLAIRDYLDSSFAETLFVEIGSDQPPRRQGSTEGLYNIAHEFDMNFFTIDNSEENHNKMREILSDLCCKTDFNIVTGKGETELLNIVPSSGLIGAAYLDNFDWIYNPILLEEKKEPPEQYQQYLDYKKAGLDLNNRNSAIAHLEQTIIVEKYSAPKCVILYDDTWYDRSNDVFLGKGCAAVIYLLARGWKLLPVTTRFSPLSHFAIAVGKNIDL